MADRDPISGQVESIDLHLQPADLMEQLSLLGLSHLVVLSLLAPGEQLAGSIEQLALPLAYLNRVVTGGALHCVTPWRGRRQPWP